MAPRLTRAGHVRALGLGLANGCAVASHYCLSVHLLDDSDLSSPLRAFFCEYLFRYVLGCLFWLFLLFKCVLGVIGMFGAQFAVRCLLQISLPLWLFSSP